MPTYLAGDVVASTPIAAIARAAGLLAWTAGTGITAAPRIGQVTTPATAPPPPAALVEPEPLIGQLWPKRKKARSMSTIIYKQSSIADIAGLQDALTALQNNSGGGGSGNDKNYTHAQNTPALAWLVNHNLGKYPSVTVVDSGGNEVEGAVAHNSLNQLVITFSVAFGGTAFCN